MEDVTRLVSTGDTVKIWDAGSMAPLDQFNPHSISHPVAQACWSSNSILSPGCGPLSLICGGFALSSVTLQVRQCRVLSQFLRVVKGENGP